MTVERFLLSGSDRTPLPDALLAGTPNPSDTIEVSLVLRRKAELDLSRHDEPIELLCCGLPVLDARIAEKDGRIALHVEARRFAEDWPTAT